jgi:NAD(P)-dependent dehydrogenase (short-subunit alcohol dehydrogenase family)
MPVTTRFGATSTAEEVLAGVDLSGKRAIVTGASSGVGTETARVLAKAGAEVTLAVRDTAAGEQAAAELTGITCVACLDLSDQASVQDFIQAWSGPLDILVNNAGVMATPEIRTTEGWELQFATNHLGHFHLTLGLHEALAAAAAARVINVSSVGHITGDILWGDPNFEHHAYDPWAAYSQSKTANVLFAVGIAQHWSTEGITGNALNPGRIASSGLISHVALEAMVSGPKGADEPGVSVKDIPQGAATSALLAGSPLVEGVTGKYFEDCEEADFVIPGIRRGVAPYALDPASATRLWQLSLELLASAGFPL